MLIEGTGEDVLLSPVLLPTPREFEVSGGHGCEGLLA